MSSQILAQCNNVASRVSSACSCILSTTSTTTVVETVTATESAEATITTTATITTGVVATEHATPTVTITNPIINGAFEGYTTTTNLLPWTGSGVASDARVEPLYPISVCGAGGYCPGGSVIIRVYPGTTRGSYFALRQDSFTAKPSTTYNVSFLYRCLNYDSSSGIDVYFKGAKVGGDRCANGNFNHIKSGIQFTTDETGAGALEFRFLNPSGLPYLYYYADDFQAKAI